MVAAEPRDQGVGRFRVIVTVDGAKVADRSTALGRPGFVGLDGGSSFLGVRRRRIGIEDLLELISAVAIYESSGFERLKDSATGLNAMQIPGCGGLRAVAEGV